MGTDRELLEAAAKAAGHSPEWREWRTGRIAEFGSIKYTNHEGFWLDGKQWNPLTDDGDALRLAVELRLNLSLDRTGIKVFHDDKPYIKAGGWESRADENEVVRRAIVRAAAEIGRSLK
jgi:hypothetical protein